MGHKHSGKRHDNVSSHGNDPSLWLIDQNTRVVPLLGVRLQIYCAKRAGSVPLSGARLQIYFVKRAGLVPLFGCAAEV